jgi:hypothetical protein
MRSVRGVNAFKFKKAIAGNTQKGRFNLSPKL